MSLTHQVNTRRLRSQQSFSSTNSAPMTDSSSLEHSSVATVQETPLKQTRPPAAAAAAPSQKYGIHVQRNKQAMQNLATSFIELNKRKVEKRVEGQSTWRSLIKGVLDLQKGKIPLLLAVEAGNQSMCRELLSAQTAEQLKVSVARAFVFVPPGLTAYVIFFVGNGREWRHSAALGGPASRR